MTLLERLGRLFNPKSEVISTSEELDAFLRQGLSESWTGIPVTYDSAMAFPPFGATVQVISETLAQLPVHVYERTESDPRDRKIVTDSPLAKVLKQPNAEQGPFEFFETLVRHAAAVGNGVARVIRVRGQVRELIPLARHEVRIEKPPTGFGLRYQVLSNGSWVDLPRNQVFHIRGPADNGLIGVNRVQRHKEAIAQGIAQERFASTFFGRGARPAGGIKVPKRLSDQAFERLKQQLREQYGGDNSNETIILEEGGEWVTISVDAEKAQLLASRKHTRSIMASLLRVPEFMIGNLDRATWANVESLARQFVDYTLMPWLIRWQQSIERQLMTPQERETQFVRYNVTSMLRGDAKARAAFYNAAIAGGWMTPNEVREKEDFPPIEGGDELRPAANIFGPIEEDDEEREEGRPED